MKIKLDENIPIEACSILAGFDVDTVQHENLAGKSDREVWDAAQIDGRVLLTQDMDFSDIRQFHPGTHAGIILLRLKSPSRREILERIKALLENDIRNWGGCFAVITDSKVRVHHPSE